MIKDKEYYFRLFRSDKTVLDRLVAHGLSGGGTYCDLYFEYTTYRSVFLDESKLKRSEFHEDYGAGIRVLKGEKTGYAYSESTSEQELAAAARAAGSIGQAVKTAAGGAAAGSAAAVRDLYPWTESWRDCRDSELAPLLYALDRSVRDREPRTARLRVQLSASESDVMMYNSFGELRYESRPMYNFTASAIFTDPELGTITANASRSFRMGVEAVTGSPEDSRRVDKLACELADLLLKDIDAAFEARRPKGGLMPVVIGAGAGGILLHEAMGHAFEADFVRKGSSVFKGRIGSRVCPAGINIVDDGTIPGNRGAGNYDDEGIEGQKTYMVRDGILESYLHDRISSAHFGVKPTGNGRREDFRCEPLPRMRATYMENGGCAPADLISSVKKGIYVDEFSNGEVKIGEGDFTFFVKRGRLIEDGRLTMPVKDVNIIGNGPEALADIRMVGNDSTIDNSTWTCGKGQSVPVSCGMPTVLIGSLTVGGE